jgi:hypothetical protein
MGSLLKISILFYLFLSLFKSFDFELIPMSNDSSSYAIFDGVLYRIGVIETFVEAFVESLTCLLFCLLTLDGFKAYMLVIVSIEPLWMEEAPDDCLSIIMEIIVCNLLL